MADQQGVTQPVPQPPKERKGASYKITQTRPPQHDEPMYPGYKP